MTTVTESDTHMMRISRRRILELTGLGLGQVVLGHLLGQDRLFGGKTASQPDFTNYRSPQRLRDFTLVFGNDLAMLEARFLRYISKLK